MTLCPPLSDSLCSPFLCRSSPFLRCGPAAGTPCSVPSFWSDTAPRHRSSPARSASDRSKARSRYCRSIHLCWRWEALGWLRQLMSRFYHAELLLILIESLLNKHLSDLSLYRFQSVLISPPSCLGLIAPGSSSLSTSFPFLLLLEWKDSGSMFLPVRLHRHLSNRVKGL